MIIRITDINVFDAEKGFYLLESTQLPAPLFLLSKPLSELQGDLNLVLSSCSNLKEIYKLEVDELELGKAYGIDTQIILLYDQKFFTY